MPGYSESDASNTDGTPYREIVEQMLDYYDKVGASEKEIMTNKLMCVDGTEGGSVLEIAWAFKTSREIIQGNMEREFLATEEFDEAFYTEMEKIREANENRKEDEIVSEYCNFVSDRAFDAKVFKINEYLSLSLENERTNIYVGGDLFQQCKYLFINLPKKAISSFNEIESIDEAADFLDNTLERNPNGKYKIPPETEFWGHCSNLQVWYENKYDTKILHRNLSFSLLERLAKVGDPLAKKVFKSELAERLETEHLPTFSYIISRIEYFNKFTKEELTALYENTTIKKNFMKSLKSNKGWLRKNAIDFIHFKFKEPGVQFLMDNFYDILPYLDKKNFETLCRIIPLYIRRREVKNRFKMNQELLEFVLRELKTIVIKDTLHEQEFILFYDGLTNFIELYSKEDVRYIDFKVLFTLIQEYYTTLNYDFDIKIEEGQYFYPYILKPKGKPYYIDILEGIHSLYSTKRELKKVLFPEENVIIDEIFQDDDNSPVRIILYLLDFSKNVIDYFKENIEKVLNALENIPQHALDQIVKSITEASLSILEKFQVIYLLMNYIFYHKFNVECRFMDHSKFHEILTNFYDQRNCDVEFELTEGDWINTYLVKPRDKPFYYDYANTEDWREDNKPLIELRKALFPDEDVKIDRIEQWESDTEPYRVYVQINPPKKNEN